MNDIVGDRAVWVCRCFGTVLDWAAIVLNEGVIVLREAGFARTISQPGVTSAGQRPGRILVGSTSYAVIYIVVLPI